MSNISKNNYNNIIKQVKNYRKYKVIKLFIMKFPKIFRKNPTYFKTWKENKN